MRDESRSVLLAVALLVAGAMPALADDYDLLRRAPGLWETTILNEKGEQEGPVTKICFDESFDRMGWDAQRATCKDYKVTRTAEGVVVDGLCTVMGMTSQTRNTITGDRQKAFQIVIDSKPQGRLPPGMPAAMGKELHMTQKLTLAGPCPPGRKPGEADMGGRIIDMRAMMQRMGQKP